MVTEMSQETAYTFYVGLFFGVNKINPHLITKETPNNLPVN